ncbi:MAG: phosphoenolpyruvate kinase [SAR324 cluster bacterium]|nr:phosphoenolpyruvate kinase [SAR324 cluster bacterium]MBL7034391.1 phosphoenolpyruvate kinase [SAR324 cluster bacterium]
MKNILTSERTSGILHQLSEANKSFENDYPGKSLQRQPVHTIYGGAHLFKAETAQKMGKLAQKILADFAPNFVTFAQALELKGSESLPTKISEINALVADAEKNGVNPSNSATWLAWRVYGQVCKKLEREAVEDFRLDYEDGFGIRPDEEEDAVAVQGAKAVALGMTQGTLPPFIGIRIKPFNAEFVERGVRTLNIFISTLLAETGGQLPDNFVVTLPKVEIPEQAAALVELFEVLEADSNLSFGDLKMEIMIETTQSVFNANGEVTARKIAKATKDRCLGAHFGTYDYTASCDLIAAYQTMDSAVCDFARDVMKVAFGGSGIFLSDGATNIMPVAPHRGENISPLQVRENLETVHRAWKLAYGHIRHSLAHGFYQGWDLHPGQIPIRYAANAAFFLEQIQESTLRLRNFVEQASKATLSGDVFDDAATGQGLLNFFFRALNSGAIDPEDVEKAGVTVEEIQAGSFRKIVEARR